MVAYGSEFGIPSAAARGLEVLLDGEGRGQPAVAISNKTTYPRAPNLVIAVPSARALVAAEFALYEDDWSIRLTEAGREVARKLAERSARRG
jgi:hypothetical protein